MVSHGAYFGRGARSLVKSSDIRHTNFDMAGGLVYNQSFFIGKSGPVRGALCFSKRCLEGEEVRMCALCKISKLQSRGQEKRR